MLHAREMSFELPDKRRVEIVADTPPDEPLWEAFRLEARA
jgi:hypothetical protein